MIVDLRFVSFAVVAGLFPAAGFASPPTVGDMVEACAAAAGVGHSSAPPTTDEVYCLGIAHGMISVLGANCQVAQQMDVASPYFYAAEAPPSNPVAAQTFVDWAVANPDRWGARFDQGLAEALVGAFPCASAQTS
jgi:hypothetical protein